MKEPHILCSKGDVCETVLLPGDPGRVFKIAGFCDKAKKVAQNREFLIYNAEYKGKKITIASTGIGAPSAAIAVEELIRCGAKNFIRVGTCGGLKKNIKVGDIIIPYAALRLEGASSEYVEQSVPAVSDIETFQKLVASAQKLGAKYHTGLNRTHDGFYESEANFKKWIPIFKEYPQIPLVSSEMECSIVFLITALRGCKAGAVLAVNTEEPLDDATSMGQVYSLADSVKAQKGIELAIKVALESVV